MIITSHMLVGAAIGAHSPNLWVAFCLGLFSHYFLDLLPHWDYLSELSTKRSALKKIALDFILGVAVVLLFVWSFPQKTLIIAGIFGALLPDFLIFLHLKFKINWLKYLYWFHQKIHFWKYLSFWQGLPVQLIVLLISVLILFKTIY